MAQGLLSCRMLSMAEHMAASISGHSEHASRVAWTIQLLDCSHSGSELPVSWGASLSQSIYSPA